MQRRKTEEEKTLSCRGQFLRNRKETKPNYYLTPLAFIYPLCPENFSRFFGLI